MRSRISAALIERCAALFVLSALLTLSAVTLTAQDGAGYNRRAHEVHAPPFSIGSEGDTPERMAALAPLWQGEIDKGITALKALAGKGDVYAALMLAGAYRTQSRLPIPPDPLQALNYYKIASAKGSGEASESIADMIEHHEVSAQPNETAAIWRALAVKQGWVEQILIASCFDWTHGPEPLHCNSGPLAPGAVSHCPDSAQMDLLRHEGLSGALQADGGAPINNYSGPTARAILIVDHSAPGEQDLQQPYAASVIYIQTPKERWRMLPRKAPLLDRFIILAPGGVGDGGMSITVQNPDGSSSGGACSSYKR